MTYGRKLELRGEERGVKIGEERGVRIGEERGKKQGLLMGAKNKAYEIASHMLKKEMDLPIVAFNVSGEYSMVKAAASAGYLNEHGAMVEMLTSIKRAGADIIITYFAKEYAQSLRD